MLKNGAFVTNSEHKCPFAMRTAANGHPIGAYDDETARGNRGA